MMKGPFDVWKMYVHLKLHFSGQLDYFDYAGRSKHLSIDAYRKRTDRHAFERMFEEYGSDTKRFLLSSFVSLRKSPGTIKVHDLLEDSHFEKQWKRYQKVEQNLSGSFRKDLQLLIRKDKKKSLKNAIRPSTGLPLLLRRCHTFDFGIESYVILNKVIPMNKLYQSEYTLDPRTSVLCGTASAYDAFLQIDKQIVKNIITEVSELEGN